MRKAFGDRKLRVTVQAGDSSVDVPLAYLRDSSHSQHLVFEVLPQLTFGDFIGQLDA